MLKGLTKKLANYIIRPKHLLVVFVIVFGFVGLWQLISSRAGSSSAVLEAENGVNSGGASDVSDSSASGGNYVLFGSPLPPVTLAKTVVNDKRNTAVFWDQINIGNLDRYEVWRSGSKVGTVDKSKVAENLVGKKSGVSPHLQVIGTSSTDVSDSSRSLDGIRDSGFGWARIDFYWWGRETSKGVYDWSTIDSAIDRAHARGVKVIGMVAYTPPWARPAATSATDKSPPNSLQDYADFAAAAVRRYGSNSSIAKYKSNPVTTWEVWNEPNISHFWKDPDPNFLNKPNPANYTAMLKLAYPAIKSTDSSSTVLVGGLSPAADRSDKTEYLPVTFLQQIYINGGKNFFDGVAIHPYTANTNPLNPVSWNTYQQIWALHYIMAAYSDTDKKIHSTEAGYGTGTCSSCVTMQQQSDYSVEALYSWWSFSFSGTFNFWVYRDTGTNQAQTFDTHGFVDRNFVAKSALSAIAKVNKQVVFVDPNTSSGTYQYEVRAIDSNGQVSISNSVTVSK